MQKNSLAATTVTQTPHTRIGGLPWGLILQFLTPLALLTAWWALSAGSSNPSYPPLSEILVRFRELWLFENFMSDIVPSLATLLLGFLAAAAGGIIVGLWFHLMPLLSELFSPIINLYRAIPTVAVIPVFISLLGFEDEVRVLIIFLSAFPPTWIATMDGMKAVEPQLLEVSRVYKLSASERIFGILFPSALPQIFTGLQVSLQFSFLVMIATEMLGSSYGIGAKTLLAQQTFVSTDMWAGIILLGIIGFTSNYILALIRRPLLRWYDEPKQTQPS